MAFGVFSDLIAELTASAGSAAGSYLASRPGLSAIIRYGQAANISGDQVLKAFRQAGGTIGNSAFWQLRREVLSEGQGPLDVGALLRGDASAIDLIPGGRAGTYQIDFRVYVQRAAGSALPEHSTTIFSMLQRDLDVNAALDAMAQIAGDVSDTEGPSGRWLSWEIISIGRYTG